ncbi:unnamed protein product [Adineta ricciae]|uniref:Uncharacterized protein n=1 Tax=Adineta ricciae TaxID=249248 RepID=A0A814DYJ4_ADIRI|nr:unnamed protein product [Adineta ricciae]
MVWIFFFFETNKHIEQRIDYRKSVPQIYTVVLYVFSKCILIYVQALLSGTTDDETTRRNLRIVHTFHYLFVAKIPRYPKRCLKQQYSQNGKMTKQILSTQTMRFDVEGVYDNDTNGYIQHQIDKRNISASTNLY